MATNNIHKNNILTNSENLEEINNRISLRNVSSVPLPPCLDLRPTATKYTNFPVNIEPTNCDKSIYPTDFSVEKVFLPSDRKGPFVGFSNNINHESYLRNQFFALQNCPQAEWVPDSSSELFT